MIIWKRDRLELDFQPVSFFLSIFSLLSPKYGISLHTEFMTRHINLIERALMLALLPACVIFTNCRGNDDNIESDETAPVEVKTYGAASWAAEYADGQTIDDSERYPSRRDGRTVGIFYFVWHGSHGYDTGGYASEPQAPGANDVKSPYDITELMKADRENPAYGPQGIFHHWGRPYLDYYVANDQWVVRKHAQMLTDAGVDVIIIDVTNSYYYEATVNKLCRTYLKMRREGNPTPQIAFIANTHAETCVPGVYKAFYTKPEYDELWFRWGGKPLLLCPEKDYGQTINSYFTMRHCWFDPNNEYDWNFKEVNGENKWVWGDYYPQTPGMKNGQPEEISIMPATHAHTGYGRSHQAERGEPALGYFPSEEESGEGTYFKLQCERALEVDPPFVFITGWNEWVAQRQVNGDPVTWNRFMGKAIGVGGTYFVDHYNHEFSRDIEPVADGFTDNYYYYMVDFIRRYKGIDRPAASSSIREITVDGKMKDWEEVNDEYVDDIGDTAHRDHFGWGRIGKLVNKTGRNDIIVSKVATDEENLYFYVRTSSDLTPHTDSGWMRLFISVTGSGNPSWEGFNFAVNKKTMSDKATMLQVCEGGWKWKDLENLGYRVKGSEMELSVPLSSLGIRDVKDFTVEFKWIDNAAGDGDILTCMKDGDSAPNGRFRYIFHHKQ